MTNGLLIMTKYLRISSYIRKPFLIYDFAPRSHMNFLIYEENLIFFFIGVGKGGGGLRQRKKGQGLREGERA